MPGCSRKHIFHPHNIYSSASLYRFKVMPRMKPKTLSHGEPTYRDEILCARSTRKEQNFSDRRNVTLLDSCQSIKPPPRPSFLSKYFQSYEPTSHFSYSIFPSPFVANNALFFPTFSFHSIDTFDHRSTGKGSKFLRYASPAHRA